MIKVYLISWTHPEEGPLTDSKGGQGGQSPRHFSRQGKANSLITHLEQVAILAKLASTKRLDVQRLKDFPNKVTQDLWG